MIPVLVQIRWVLVPKPPCERPSAWSWGSRRCAAAGPPNSGGGSGFFFRPGGSLVGTNDRGIDAPQVAVDEPGLIELQQQGVEDLGPGAVLAPAVEAVVDGLPGAVAFGGVGPGGPGVQMPEDAVDQGAVILPGMARLAALVAVGKERLDLRPLGVRQVVAVHGWPP